jgi:hypothetical protein
VAKETVITASTSTFRVQEVHAWNKNKVKNKGGFLLSYDSAPPPAPTLAGNWNRPTLPATQREERQREREGGNQMPRESGLRAKQDDSKKARGLPLYSLYGYGRHLKQIKFRQDPCTCLFASS